MTTALLPAPTDSASPVRTGLRPPRGGKSGTRPYLSAVPDCEPPFDDDANPAGRLRMLRTEPRPAPLRPPGQPAGLRPSGPGRAPIPTPPVVPAGPLIPTPTRGTLVAAAAVPGWSREADVGVRRTQTSELPPAEQTGAILARALIEVLSGLRPSDQLRAHCSPEVHGGLEDLPMISGTGLPRLLKVHVGAPADGAAEVSAVFRRGERVRGMAFRLDGLDGRWRVTALQLG